MSTSIGRYEGVIGFTSVVPLYGRALANDCGGRVVKEMHKHEWNELPSPG